MRSNFLEMSYELDIKMKCLAPLHLGDVKSFLIPPCRSSTQESTGESHHYMLYGEEMQLPIDIAIPPADPEDDEELTTDYAMVLWHKLRATHARAREVLKKAAKRQNRSYDRKAVHNPIASGTFVWLHNEVRRKGCSLAGMGRTW